MKLAETNRPAPKTGVKMHDILYILFKHKWKIIIPTLLGFAVAATLAFRSESMSPSYETKAELLVRYVVERNSNDPDAPVSRSNNPETVMDTEIEILTSFNVALDTVNALTPEKVMTLEKGEPTVVDAAGHVATHLTVEAQRGSNIIKLSYRDSDPKRAVEVLNQVIQSYFARHLEIHRSTTAFDQVNAETDKALTTLRVTEEDINQLKSKSGVISMEGTVTEFESRRQLINSNLMAAQAALAGQRAKVAAMEKNPASPKAEPEKKAGDKPAVAEAAPADTPENQDKRRETAKALAEYLDLNSRLDLMRQERNRTLLTRPETDPKIKSLDKQISQVQAQKFDLGVKYPDFNRRVEAANNQTVIGPVVTLEDEQALLAEMEARVAESVEQSKKIEAEVEGLSALGFKLEELERRRQIEEEKYRYYQITLEKARVDRTLDPTNIPNLSIVQDPSSPMKSIDSKTMKLIMGVGASGLILGLGLAFLTEWVIDRRISRPEQIRARLQMPLMLSIPYSRSKDGIAKLIGSTDPLNPPPLPAGRLAIGNNGELKPQKSGPAHFIEPYTAAIHDRILFNFELNNITHKPKLVALTGLSTGAGSSTIATGLAKSFAENGTRKVLLVDLNPPANGAETNGHGPQSLRHALDLSRTEQFRESPRSLYFASAPTRRFNGESTSLAPLGLREILPNLVASEFDYIIFDMPPVDATSPTVAMAGFMDKVLLILDAEDTTPDRLEWAYAELQKGRADVSCILNKVKSHAPRWVEGHM